MSQSCLVETSIASQWELTPVGDVKIAFIEYEAGGEPTGRTWSGMITDKDLFDLLMRVGVVTLDTFELGTGVRNPVKERKRHQ